MPVNKNISLYNIPNNTKVSEYHQRTDTDDMFLRFGCVMGKSTSNIIVKYPNGDYMKYDIHTGKNLNSNTYIQITSNNIE